MVQYSTVGIKGTSFNFYYYALFPIEIFLKYIIFFQIKRINIYYIPLNLSTSICKIISTSTFSLTAYHIKHSELCITTVNKSNQNLTLNFIQTFHSICKRANDWRVGTHKFKGPELSWARTSHSCMYTYIYKLQGPP